MRRWVPWLLWCLSLGACPIAIIVLSEVYDRSGHPAWNEPRPWAAQIIESLLPTQLVVSVISATHVLWLTSGGRRWLAWGAVVAVLILTALLAFGGVMATTGTYL